MREERTRIDEITEELFKDKTVLLSFPRSGLHLVMYIVQFLTGKGIVEGIDKPDSLLLGERGHKGKPANHLSHVNTNDAVAIRRHFTNWKGERGYSLFPSRLLLIIRDPVETILSHYCSRNVYAIDDIFETNWLTNNEKYVETCCREILSNLRSYDACKQPKCIVVYEDLVFNNTASVVKQIGRFFGVPKKNIRLFLGNFDLYRRDCLQVLLTPAKSDSPDFYATRLTDVNLTDLRSIIFDLLDHPIVRKLYGNKLIETQDV